MGTTDDRQPWSHHATPPHGGIGWTGMLGGTKRSTHPETEPNGIHQALRESRLTVNRFQKSANAMLADSLVFFSFQRFRVHGERRHPRQGSNVRSPRISGLPTPRVMAATASLLLSPLLDLLAAWFSLLGSRCPTVSLRAASQSCLLTSLCCVST